MNSRWIASGALLGAAVLAGAGARSAGAADQSGGEEAFGEVAKVLLSPRCRNCHPSGDAPLQGDRPVPHAMNVSRHSNDAGLQCTGCHRETNHPLAGAPPGAHDWRLPPATTPMVFEGRTPRELCVQLKDPAKTGGRDLGALRDHLGHDALVLWGWKPGPGRSTPPLSHADMMKNLEVWIAAGAPCPR
jgi:hypothetical protein